MATEQRIPVQHAASHQYRPAMSESIGRPRAAPDSLAHRQAEVVYVLREDEISAEAYRPLHWRVQE